MPQKRFRREAEPVVTDWQMLGVATGLAGCLLVASGVLFTRAHGRKPVEAPAAAMVRALPESRAAQPATVAVVPPLSASPDPVNLPAQVSAEVRQASPKGVCVIPARAGAGDATPHPVQLDYSTESDLARALRDRVPELDLNKVRDTSKSLLEEQKSLVAVVKGKPGTSGELTLLQEEQLRPLREELHQRADLRGLAFQMGKDCVTGEDAASNLEKFAFEIRSYQRRANLDSLDREYGEQIPGQRGPHPFDAQPEEQMTPELAATQSAVNRLLRQNRLRRPEAVPALEQVLQAEDETQRVAVTRLFGMIEGPHASAALARRAVFDLSDLVRWEAIEALKNRPPADFRSILLRGMRYPWLPAAEHAAEALMAIGDRGAVFDLVKILDEPRPLLPIKREDGTWEAPQMVRINHLRNCLLCHAGSFENQDAVRGLIPTPGVRLSRPYYAQREIFVRAGPNSDFVRADVVYLRQDFSVMQKVELLNRWPKWQRFDYLIQKQVISEQKAGELTEKRAADAERQQRSVLAALRSLTSIDAGSTAGAWKKALAGRDFTGGDKAKLTSE
jgi:hypothetical protein